VSIREIKKERPTAVATTVLPHRLRNADVCMLGDNAERSDITSVDTGEGMVIARGCSDGMLDVDIEGAPVLNDTVERARRRFGIVEIPTLDARSACW
jgi:hypothetical protein